jgi:hypothetical protein
VLDDGASLAQAGGGVAGAHCHLSRVSEGVGPAGWLLFCLEGVCCFLIQRRSVGEPTLAPR